MKNSEPAIGGTRPRRLSDHSDSQRAVKNTEKATLGTVPNVTPIYDSLVRAWPSGEVTRGELNVSLARLDSQASAEALAAALTSRHPYQHAIIIRAFWAAHRHAPDGTPMSLIAEAALAHVDAFSSAQERSASLQLENLCAHLRKR